MKRIVAGIVVIVAFLAFTLGTITFSGQKSSAVTLPVPLPTVTVTKLLPRPTVTETRLITLPPRPQATKTVTVIRLGPTHTVIKPGPTTTVRATVKPSPVLSTKTVYVTPPPKVVTHPGEAIKISVPKAVGLSLGLVILGVILGLIAVYASYAVGYKDSEHKEASALKDIRTELFGKRDIE